MAVRYAVATGNWSATATWNGGTLPTSADDVYANTYTVTIDQDVTVLSLRTTSNTSPAVTAGGGFVVSTARTINVTGTGILPGASGSCLTGSHTSGTTVTINGAISGNSTSQVGLNLSSNGTTNITGNVAGGAGGANANGIVINGVNHVLSITGTVTGNAAGLGLFVAAASTFTVTGNVSAGATGQPGISVTAAATGTVTGTVTAGSAVNAIAISSTGTYSIVGQIQASGTVTALNVTGAATVTMTGPFISSSNGSIPFSGPTALFKLSPISNNEYRFLAAAGGTSSLWSTDVNGGQPSAANVRYGTTYGVGGALTGTCRVPAAGSVALGVLVDNTTGTAVLTPAAIWDTLTSTMTTSGSIGERLKNTATVATTGDQLAATFP